jgi:hypothetical protein
MGRRCAPLQLNEIELAELRSRALGRSTVQGLAPRARIILACAKASRAIARRSAGALMPIRSASDAGVDGLRDEPRSGTPRTIEGARIER